MEQKTKPLIRASIIVIMLFQVAALFIRSYLEIELVESGIDTKVAKHLSYFVVPVILLVLMWPIVLQNKDPLRRLLRLPTSWQKIIPAAIGLGVSLRLVWWSGVLTMTAFGWLDTAPPGQEIYLAYYFACPPIYVLILTVSVMSILTPIQEEIVNRGFILGSLSHKDPRYAVVLSAVLFAILHKPSGIPDAFVFGLFAGVQLLNYQTLWAPIIAHGTYNLLHTLDWACLHVTWLPEDPTTSTILFGSGTLLVGLISGGIAIWIVAFMRPGADQPLRAIH